ncbi:hypothetical protein L6472_06090 [Prevotella sp. E13-17]|uniref:hypothetical protein n=1 Tax=Prevotella sp. E13-17 TaxID=2913616 RepID=UPI001EDA57D2|nr:hypothetical protein [Prevotella sp. E13-17]UKK52148.1 hypothetical protein L6472_06090 [Prevotella sp. E13-17]
MMTEEYITKWLIETMYAARKNKRYGRDSIDFERRWVPELRRMAHALATRSFRVERNYAFLTSVPKWREIFATEFQGRMADHLLCDSLSPYIEQELHSRTFNNRVSKGSQAAINQVIEDIAEVTGGYREPARIIKWDLKGFFPNANLDVMCRLFCELIDRHADDIVSSFDDETPEFLKWLAMVIIHCRPQTHYELRTPWRLWKEHIEPEKSLFSKPPGIGAHIGRMTSQTGMGLYLNDEVRWLNDECGIRSTLFMDDCVMVVPGRLHSYALSLFPELRRRLAAKGVRMNEKKFYDQPYQHGLEFLGSHIRAWSIILNDVTYARAIARIKEYNAIPNNEKYYHLDRFVSTVNSYTGLLKNRTSFRRICRLRDAVAAEWWQWLEWDYNRKCITYKQGDSPNERLNDKYHLNLKCYDTIRNHRAEKCSGQRKADTSVAA